MPSTPAQPVLALPGPHYWYDWTGGGFTIRGTAIVVQPEGNQGRGTGWSIWDGAVAAALHLELAAAVLTQQLSSPRVLELGSGTGLLGLAAAAALQLPVTVTDLPQVLPALQHNVALNARVAPLVQVQACDWLHPPRDASQLGGPFGLVLAADCVWLEELVRPFVRTLQAVCSPGTQVLMAHQSRSRRVDELLFGVLEQAYLVDMVQLLPGELDRGKVQLYRMQPH